MKRTAKLLLATSMLLTSLVGCGASEETTNVIKVGAMPFPYVDILNEMRPMLEDRGFELEIVEFVEYVQPNLSLNQGELTANYYQHVPFMDQFNEQNGTEIASVSEVHYFPLGLYSGKTESLDDIFNGAKIAVPNDVTNEARALMLLEAQGIITLAEGADITATINDIVENPYNVEIIEIEAAQVPRSRDDVDFAIITGNYAIEAGYNVTRDALAIESEDSLAYETYGIVLAVKDGTQNDPAVKALVEVIESEEIQGFINDTYDGCVIAMQYNK